MAKLLSALLLAAITAAAAPALAQDKQLQFLSFPQGSITYGASTAIAGAVSRKTDYSVLPVPYAGPQVFMPMLDRGEGAFALINSGDSKQAYTGVKPNYERAYRNIRLVGIGYENAFGPLVTIKSRITSAASLRGKAIAGKYSAHQSCLDIATATLADLGMTWSDVVVVPVATIVAGVAAMGDGRAVASLCAGPDLAIVRETNLRTPMRYISIDPRPDALARAGAIFPGLRSRKMLAGSAETVVEDVDAFVYNFYLLTNAGVSDDAIYAVTKTIWDSLPELEQAHAIFKTWLRERMAEADVTVPYHPGAIRFYKEQGVWSDEKQAATTRLLSGS